MDSTVAARQDLESIIGTVSLGDPRSRNALLAWSGLAHDLRNLLQTATSAIGIIERSVSAAPPVLDLAIAGAKASIANASELVARAFAAADPSATIESVIDVAECLNEVAAVIASAIDPGIELDLVADSDLPPISCDRLGLQNALLNLVLNARDAVAANGRIGIRIRRAAGESIVQICVIDNGIGMSAEVIARAFQPGFTTKADGVGGIGLHMVERFVRSAGGDIRIESDIGTGTIVTMQLPSNPPKQND